MERQQLYPGLRTLGLGTALLKTWLRTWAAADTSASTANDAAAATAQTLFHLATRPADGAGGSDESEDTTELLLAVLAEPPDARARLAGVCTEALAHL